MNSKNIKEEAVELVACVEGAWRLYDLRTNCQIDHLNIHQVRALLSSMNYERHCDWVCWDASLLEWKSVSHFPELKCSSPDHDSSVTAISEEPVDEKMEIEYSQVTETAPGARTAVGSMSEPDSHQSQNIQQYQERRRHKRWSVCVAVELSSENYKIWTSTVDVSLGGLRFQERIPKRFDGLFKARITKGGQSVEVNCLALWDSGKSDSFRAKVADEADNDRMQTLITQILKLADSPEELLLV